MVKPAHPLNITLQDLIARYSNRQVLFEGL